MSEHDRSQAIMSRYRRELASICNAFHSGRHPRTGGQSGSFAALACAAPNPALSGVTHASPALIQQANAALYRTVRVRQRHREPPTMAYVECRRGKNLTNWDLMRCLKQRVANEGYAALLDPATDNRLDLNSTVDDRRSASRSASTQPPSTSRISGYADLRSALEAKPNSNNEPTSHSLNSKPRALVDTNRNVRDAGLELGDLNVDGCIAQVNTPTVRYPRDLQRRSHHLIACVSHTGYVGNGSDVTYETPWRVPPVPHATTAVTSAFRSS